MDDTLIKKLRSDAIGLQAWADGKGPYPETVRGVSKMMAQRVLKAAAEIERLNAHLTDLTRTHPAPVEQDVERVARAIWLAQADPEWEYIPSLNEQWDALESEFRERAYAQARVALSTLTPARAEGFKAGVEAAVAWLLNPAGKGSEDAVDFALDFAEHIRALGSNDHG